MKRGWLAALVFVAACETVTVGTPPPEERAAEPAPVVEEPGDAECATLTRARCMRSLVCTLAAPPGRNSDRYVCRRAAGNCEFGLRQVPEDEDRCSQRTGCTWRDAPCFCACRGVGRSAVEDGADMPVCQCECSGGPPPGCMSRG